MLFTTYKYMYLARACKPQTIKVYLFGIRNLHIKHGFPDPLSNALQLRCLLRGIKRLKGTSRFQTAHHTLSILRAFHSWHTTII